MTSRSPDEKEPEQAPTKSGIWVLVYSTRSILESRSPDPFCSTHLVNNLSETKSTIGGGLGVSPSASGEASALAGFRGEAPEKISRFSQLVT